jgi:muconolactone delta-isomerase
MAEIYLPEEFTQEFMSLIPSQRSHINQLMSEGVISSYTLTLDRSRLWVIFLADSSEVVWEALDGFPIIQYIEADIHELMFHNTVSRDLPVISLN